MLRVPIGANSGYVLTQDSAKKLNSLSGMGGRVVEGTGLENRQAGNRLVGSNPTPSAIVIYLILLDNFIPCAESYTDPYTDGFRGESPTPFRRYSRHFRR